MAVTGITGKPQVVKYGSAHEERYAYVDGAAIEMGDLIRINTAGEVVLAALTTGTAGAVHGIALEAVASEVNETVSVLLFAADTEVALQTDDSTAIFTAPSTTNIAKQASYTIAVTSGVWNITSTAVAGVALVTDYAATGQPWHDVSGTYSNVLTAFHGTVYVRFAQSILDGAAA